MGSKRKQDVAWGFFWTTKGGVRYVYTSTTKADSRHCRRWQFLDNEPGPIFRITPPKPSAGKRGKDKK